MDQLSWLKKNHIQFYYANAIARPHFCQTFYLNTLSVIKNELAGIALIVDSVSCISVILHAIPFASALSRTFDKLVAKYTNTNLYKTIKLASKVFVSG